MPSNSFNLNNLEPTPVETARLTAQAYAEKSFDELVFCGYGEPPCVCTPLLK